MPTYKDSMQNKASKILRLLAQSEDDFSKGKSTRQKDLFDSLEKELKRVNLDDALWTRMMFPIV